MNHHSRVSADVDLVPYHGDDGGCAGRESIHEHDLRRAVIGQARVDGARLEQRSTRTVDMDVEALHTRWELREVAGERLCAHIAHVLPVAYLREDEKLRRIGFIHVGVAAESVEVVHR